MTQWLKRFTNWRWAPWCVAAVCAVLAVGLTFFWVGAQYDSARRYAPMAECFAAGDWGSAFHPRFGVGFQVLTGSWVWLSGQAGLRACAQVALVAWALAVPFVFALARRLFDCKVAWMAVALYVICPMLFGWAHEGMRESFRTLGVLLAVLGILERRDGASGFGKFFAALPLLCMFRADTIVIAGAFTFVYALYDRFCLRTWVLAVWGVLCLQPTCYLAWYRTGIWLPSVQFVQMWQKFVEAVL